jgi:hypothetical protein
MRKQAWLLCVTVLALAAPGLAQGVRYNGEVRNNSGLAVPYASVYICTLAATGTPCSPTANIYSDPSLTQALANPIQTDPYGRYGFWIAPGSYTEQVSGFGIATFTRPFSSLSSAKQVYNVKDYGAAGDGSTSDTAAVQAAITAANGGIVYFPSGTYLVGSLSLPSGTTLQGEGSQVAELKWTGTTGTLLSNGGSANNITVTGLTLDGNNTAATGIGFSGGTTFHKIRMNVIQNFSGSGGTCLKWDFVLDSAIDNNQFQGCYNALVFSNSSNNDSVKENWIYAGNVNPISVSDSGQVVLARNLIQSNTGPIASYVKNGQDVVFDADWVENNGDGTANSRAFVFQTDSGSYSLENSIKHCYISGGTNGANGTALGFTGSGGHLFPTLENNYWIGYSGFQTGASASMSMVCVNDNNTLGGSVCNVALGGSIATAGTGGVTFSPAGATRVYTVFGGAPGNYQGYFVVYDVTDSAVILDFVGSNWYTNNYPFDAGSGWVRGGAFLSDTANAAGTGQVRLASGDAINFRNNANSADVNGVSKDSSDVVHLGGTAGASVATLTDTLLSTAGFVTNTAGGLLGTSTLTGAGFGSQTANYFLAAPNGSTGNPSFRAIVAADLVAYNTPSASTNSSISATTMATAPSGGTAVYRFTWYLDVTVAGSGCTTNTIIAPTLYWTDPNASSQTSNGNSFSIGTAPAVGSWWGTVNAYEITTLAAKANTTVQYAVSYTPGSGCSPAPQIQIYPILERVM